ncbi:YigZ family protein [Thiomicrorhabdus sp. ZW0627]|uniref:YigZ family protein n=1 Tax=Thiomicrorhabdus sp. ZW0627 TaxID=3039774 RepID=UPI0024367B51|nr:YigZ family protein [Thiomicrorhabdus sp. ZW0627]MDG6774261.1 YigZ family protein [Thiomicrorhabdus sp. ZW0627]
MSYPIPAQQAVAEIEIKKSRFIAYARHVVSRETGMEWLEEIKAEYPDARHHCWAYQLGNPNCATNAGMGDDGEPSGTAGKPILNVLQHKGIGDVMIIVVRYFGGIKLGAGGLTRAYGQAAQAVMEILPTQERIPMTGMEVVCDFALEQNVRHWLGQVNGELLSVDYQHQVTIRAEVPDEEVDGLSATLRANRCTYSFE